MPSRPRYAPPGDGPEHTPAEPRSRPVPRHPSACLEIFLLGGLRLRLGEAELALPTRKAQALLAYLARRPGQIHPREKIQALLWADSGRTQAQASLRQTLFLLNRSLPPGVRTALVTTGSTVALDPARVRVDVELLERDVADATLPALERVLASYGGHLLDGFVVDEPSFDDWAEAERARMRGLVASALEDLVERQAGSGTAERAIQTAQHLVRLEPYRERTLRRLMELHASQGQRAAALLQYRSCAAALQRELGVEPEERTRQLYLDLLHPPKPSGQVRSPARPAPRRPLIGRERDLACLEEALEGAWAGHAGPLVVLTGDAGVGKTRLLEEAAAWATERGGRCLRGRCFESEQVLPFAPWVDLLRSASLPDALWHRLPEGWRAEIARIVPRREPGVVERPREPQDALALFEAIDGLLRYASDEAPLLVVLEDLHWSDAMSLRLLSFLARRGARDSRVCLMASVRAEDLGAAGFLRMILNEIDREQRLRETAVAPLSRSETGALVKALAPSAAAPAVTLDQVWATSEGNPLVVVEICRALESEPGMSGAARLQVPSGIRALIAGHVDRLDALGQSVLATAAVIGREFEFPWLRRACEGKEDALAIALEELVRSRLLQPSGAGFSFTHDRTREVVYERLHPARRMALHGAVARALRTLGADRLDEIAGTLGFHYARAGDAAESIAHLRRFADRAARSYGLDEALAALEHALEQVPALPASERDATAVAIRIQQAYCLCHLDRAPDVVTLLEPQCALVAALDRPTLAAPFHFWLTFAYRFAGDRAKAKAHGASALLEAERCGDAHTAGMSHWILGWAAVHSGEPQLGIAHCREAVARLDGSGGEPEPTALAWAHLGLNYSTAGESQLALDAFARALSIAEEARMTRTRSLVLALRAFTHLGLGALGAAIDASRQAVELASDPLTRVIAHWSIAHVFAMAKRVEDEAFVAAVATLVAAAESAEPGALRGWTGHVLAALAHARLAQGDFAGARASAQRSLGAHRESGDPLGVAITLRILGQVAIALGECGEAVRALEESRAILDGVGAPLEVAFTRVWLGVARRVTGDEASADGHFAAARDTFVARGAFPWATLVEGLAPGRTGPEHRPHATI